MITQNYKLYRIFLFGQTLTRNSQVKMQSFVDASRCSAASVSLNQTNRSLINVNRRPNTYKSNLWIHRETVLLDAKAVHVSRSGGEEVLRSRGRAMTKSFWGQEEAPRGAGVGWAEERGCRQGKRGPSRVPDPAKRLQPGSKAPPGNPPEPPPERRATSSTPTNITEIVAVNTFQ